jgi:hypothetical protein
MAYYAIKNYNDIAENTKEIGINWFLDIIQKREK